MPQEVVPAVNMRPEMHASYPLWRLNFHSREEGYFYIFVTLIYLHASNHPLSRSF